MLAEAGHPPVTNDIYFGLQTTDEMCMQTFGVVADVPPGRY
jgi:hypothetical protein